MNRIISEEEQQVIRGSFETIKDYLGPVVSPNEYYTLFLVSIMDEITLDHLKDVVKIRDKYFTKKGELRTKYQGIVNKKRY